jgi:hypothetical protein
MSLNQLWNAIYGSGCAMVSPPLTSDDEPDSNKIEEAIREIESAWRMELCGTAPPLNVAVTRWALKLVRSARQFLVFREIDHQTIRRELAEACPAASGSTIYFIADICWDHAIVAMLLDQRQVLTASTMSS